jgi:hypothetical protein
LRGRNSTRSARYRSGVASITTSPDHARSIRLNFISEKSLGQSLKDMRAKWSANKGKLKACRQDVKVKGLAGDDRWFYIEECMGKS